MDRRGILHASAVLGTSNPGAFRADLGGVARNVAQNLTRLGCPVFLCSRAGDDESGREVLAQPIDTSLVTVSRTCPTASYTAILEPTGELVIGIADMDIYDEMTPEVLVPALPRLKDAGLWFLDSNLPAETIGWLLSQAEVPVAVDAISVAKSRRLLPYLASIDYLFCNLAQAGSLAGVAFTDSHSAAEALRGMGASSGVVTAGPRGIAVFDRQSVFGMPALPAQPRDVTGAGDALVAGTLYGLSQNLDLHAASRLGLAAAAITVESQSSAAADLSRESLHARA